MTQKSECGCAVQALTAQPSKASVSMPTQRLTIEFMYLDRTACAPCQLTETALEAALTEAAGLMDALGVEVDLRKIHIRSLEQALALGFALSPTIRVNGVDISLDSRASPCPTCSEVSGAPTDCRVWLYQGRAYDAPPKAMIVDALLKAAHKSAGITAAITPVSDHARANLKRFFDAQRKITAGPRPGAAPVGATACCAPALADSAGCCEPPVDGCCGAAGI